MEPVKQLDRFEDCFRQGVDLLKELGSKGTPRLMAAMSRQFADLTALAKSSELH